MRPIIIIILLASLVLFLSLPSSAAIGIFNHRIQTTGSQPPAVIQYRLNCPGTVTIDILDEGNNTVCSLGPYAESFGLHSHSWDGTGINSQSRLYRARINATAQQMGTPGTLTRLAGETTVGNIYGIAIDKCPTSPGYGTIYVSWTVPGGAIRAFYPDGTPKKDFGPDPANNILNLGFSGLIATSPWGISVDDQGNIYTACRSAGASTGIKVYDYLGNQLCHVFPDEPQGIFWLAGLTNGGQYEVYETTGQIVRYTNTASPAWNEVVRFPSDLTAKQISFEPGGKAFFVAVSGMNGTVPNRGVWRFTREPGGTWVCDSSFDAGLSSLVSANNQLAAWCATGVSCDSIDPDGAGPRTCSRLWMGLGVSPAYFGGNIIRKMLPNGTLDMFTSPGKIARIVAADAVGNVAIEYDITDSGAVWNHWGLYAPAGESSSDTRTTAAVLLSGTQTVVPAGSIAELHALSDGSQVELTIAKTVAAIFGDGCYLVESNRSAGIKVEGITAITEGIAIKLRGTLTTENGERLITNAEIIP